MHNDTYELEFERFLESTNLDAAEDALFSALRAAFDAGWQAAGGMPPPLRRAVLFPKKQL